jgi:putative membrane protein
MKPPQMKPDEMFTTASTKIRANFTSNRVLQALTAVYGVIWLVTAIAPTSRFDWFLENLLVFGFVGLLATTYRAFPLSDLSYTLIAVFLSLHAVGAHYTYSESPMGFWLKEALDLERNHYDRLVHFLFGLLFSYPLREAVMRGAGVSGRWCYALSFALALSLSNLYEILEWAVAEVVDPEAAFAFLGTQGDAFDAQKDMLFAATGMILGLGITAMLSAGGPSDRGR